MPNCSERAVSTVIVNPNVSVRPANHGAWNVVCIDKEHRIIIDHFVNAAVPGGDVNDAVPICAQAGHRDSAAHCWPVLPIHTVPFEEAVLPGRDPDVALDVGEHCVHLIRRVVHTQEVPLNSAIPPRLECVSHT